MERKGKTILLVTGGIAIGVANGFFGGGGGMLCVPVLKGITKAEDKKAHATAVFVMAITSIPSLVIYITAQQFNFFINLYAVMGVLIGGSVGAILLTKLKNDAINMIFITIMFGVGIKMLIW